MQTIPLRNSSFLVVESTVNEFKTEVMGETRALNSDLGLEDLDKLEAKAEAEFTNRATSCEMKKIPTNGAKNVI